MLFGISRRAARRSGGVGALRSYEDAYARFAQRPRELVPGWVLFLSKSAFGLRLQPLLYKPSADVIGAPDFSHSESASIN
jgi:hypothetical protein